MAEDNTRWIEVPNFSLVPIGARYREEGVLGAAPAGNARIERKVFYARPPLELPPATGSLISVSWSEADLHDHENSLIRWKANRWESASDVYDDDELLELIDDFKVLYTPGTTGE